MWERHGKITLDDATRFQRDQEIKFIGKDKIKAADVVVGIAVQ